MVLFLLVAFGLVGFTAYAQLGWRGPVDVPRSAKWVEGIRLGAGHASHALRRGRGEDESQLARQGSPTRQVQSPGLYTGLTRERVREGNWCSEKRKKPRISEVFCLCFF